MQGPAAGRDPDAPVKAAHVALYRAGEERAYGGGLLIADGRLLTCAHVVNQALGRHPFEQLPPPVDGLRVALPGQAAAGRLRVVVEQWWPARRSGDLPAREGDSEWSGDLALLRVVDRLPDGAATVPFGYHRYGPTAFAWYGSGHASTVAAVVVQGRTEDWLVLDTPASAQGVVEGYSGSPLWDRERQCVVGLVVSRRRERAFAIPTEALQALLPDLTPVPGPVAAGSVAAGRREDAHGTDRAAPYHATMSLQLIDPVGRILVDAADRADCAREFAEQLGVALPTGDPSAEWFVLTALTARHGIPTLAALLSDRTPGPKERLGLQIQALYAAPDELLTCAENRQLLDLLATHPARPRRIAARALPLGPALDDVDWPELVRLLESYRPRFGKVPSLLRVVEFAAAEAADMAARSALRAWNDAVAARLELAEELAEHRITATEATHGRRARTGDEPPAVQVQLWRSGATDSFGCTVRLHGADGSTVHRSFHDAPIGRTALLDLLAEVLAQVTRESEPGALPRVEFFVQKDELDLDVDQWVYRPDEFFPSVLGQDFLVVLRCPELRRPEYWPELRYRWQTRHTGDVLVQERRDPAVQERGRATPVCGVALCCAPPGTRPLRAIALAVGVPGVVWPRPGADPRAGTLLRELAAGLTASQLPRAVYEARIAAAGGEGIGRHLACVWDGPTGIPASLPLSDPPE